MEYTILNNGCSFSAHWSPDDAKFIPDRTRPKNKKGKTRGGVWVSYCDFIPGKIYNIAYPGSGIESIRIPRLINGESPFKRYEGDLLSADTNLTHFIYQIPSFGRMIQPDFLDQYSKVYWTIPDILKNRKRLIHSKQKIFEFGDGKAPWRDFIEDAPYVEHYTNEALAVIDTNVIMVRKKWPDIKIIFLRYTHSGGYDQLVWKFSEKFHMTHLSDYCNENNITYICEDNFHTEWFKNNHLTGDKRHPNEAGAKLIADKIKEYL